jgi:hypothetical protein
MPTITEKFNLPFAGCNMQQPQVIKIAFKLSSKRILNARESLNYRTLSVPLVQEFPEPN